VRPAPAPARRPIRRNRDLFIIPAGLREERIEIGLPAEEKISLETGEPLVQIGEEDRRESVLRAIRHLYRYESFARNHPTGGDGLLLAVRREKTAPLLDRSASQPTARWDRCDAYAPRDAKGTRVSRKRRSWSVGVGAPGCPSVFAKSAADAT